MNRKPIPNSPYSMGLPGNSFISPMSIPAQRHPNSPRFHQQFVPHFSGPGWTPPPRPTRSPHHSGRSPRADFNNSGYSPRHHNNSSGSPHNSFDKSGPSPSPNYHKRGHHNFNKDRFSSWGGGPDCNPGGSDDIRQYYNPSMLKDPWEKMQAVPATNASCTSTTT